MGMTYTAPLDARGWVRIYSKELNDQTVLEDCMTGLKGSSIVQQGDPIPNATFFEVSGDVNSGARNARFPLVQNYFGPGQEGTAQASVGQEEDLLTQYFDPSYNDVAHVASLQEYGIEKITKDWYQLFEEIVKKEAIYWKEREGRYIREAYVERFSNNLTQPPRNLVQEFNPNIAPCGTVPANWPVFSATGGTYVNRIVNALNLAGVGQAAACTVRYLQTVEEQYSAGQGTRNVLIEPVMLGGKPTFITVLPSPQCRWLKDPNTTGQLGRIWTEASGLTKEETMIFPGVIGRLSSKLLVVEDVRYPTLTPGGSAGAWSLTALYRLYGNDATSDPRDKTSNARQVGFLLGKAGMAKWAPDPYHFEYNYEQYDRWGGKGVFASCGWTQVQWDYGTGTTDLTRYQNSSALMIFANPPAFVS